MGMLTKFIDAHFGEISRHLVLFYHLEVSPKELLFPGRETCRGSLEQGAVQQEALLLEPCGPEMGCAALGEPCEVPQQAFPSSLASFVFCFHLLILFFWLGITGLLK